MKNLITELNKILEVLVMLESDLFNYFNLLFFRAVGGLVTQKTIRLTIKKLYSTDSLIFTLVGGTK